jgi:hypothetical protein
MMECKGLKGGESPAIGKGMNAGNDTDSHRDRHGETGREALAPFFNPRPEVQVLPLPGGSTCVVIDQVLCDPDAVVRWASVQRFVTPPYPYPGRVCDVPASWVQRTADHFAEHVRKALGARRTLDLTVRLSVIDTPPEALAPVQWMCHRDRYEVVRPEILFAACVLYLFRDPALGGTSFYRPRLSAEATERLVADSKALDAQAFGSRYGLRAGYMDGSNAYFERVARVPAAWNRAIFYDGGLFHSADVGPAPRMQAEVDQARLTLNGFLTCRRIAA